MTFRVSTNSAFNRFLSGVQDARFRSYVAQEQLSSGRRIVRPSDDPIGASRSLALSRRLSGIERFSEAIAGGQSTLDRTTASLQQASGMLTEGRTLLLQAMNGTLSGADRRSIASEFKVLREQLLDIGNMQIAGEYVFGGTRSDAPPWEKVEAGGRSRVVYRGNEDSQKLRISDSVEVAINLPGLDVFSGGDPLGASFTTSTGLLPGTTASEGTGYEVLTLRHDSTDAGALAGAGVALVDGGAADTLLGSHALVIDATAGTVQLGSGPVRTLPGPGEEDLADFVVENEAGGKLHLDFTAFAGADYAGSVTGEGSIAIDGSNFVALDFGEADLRLTNAGTGSTVHVDATALGSAGEELVTFSGTLNLFDLMRGIEEDLLNEADLDPQELLERLESRLGELDRGSEGLIGATSVLGSRASRLAVSGERAQGVGVALEGLLSSTRDADITEVAIELARADATLQLAQSAGARLLQTTLLNFLG